MAHGSHAHTPPWNGRGPRPFNPALPGRFYTWSAKLLGGSMWFFLLYRLREDGKVVFGIEHPFANGHGKDGHGEENNHH
ncbi:hypothetical protein BT69DRAFT_1352076 [Atractiella rhizophila]|nr:hypothetical protein BT69DRAFT_1352076 [Atractiella rhizophila]